MHLSDLWRILGIVGAGAACVAAVLLLAPDQIADPQLRGYRKNRREAALAGSALLRLLWPLIRLASYYAALLPMKQYKEKLNEKLRYAGEPAGLSVDEFLGVRLVAALGGLAAGLGAAWLLEMGVGVVIIAGFLGAWLPSQWLHDKADTRLRSINRGLPQALDLIVMAMGAGLDFIGSVRHVVEKWSDKKDPLYEELSRFLSELSLGKTRKDALSDLAQRAPTEMVKTFVTNAIQAERRGTPLIEVLRIQADVARTRRFQAAEKVAGRAGVVILMPLVLIFVATVLVMFGSLIVKGFRGQLF